MKRKKDMSNLADVRRFSTPGFYLAFVVFWGFFLTVSIAIFAAAVLSPSGTVLTWFLLFVLLIVLLIPLGIGATSKSLDIFELIYIISFLYFLNFLVRSLYILNSPEALHALHGRLPPAMSFSVINQTLICVIIGFAFLLVGYYSVIPEIVCKLLPKSRLLKGTPRKVATKISLIYAVGILFRLLLFTREFGFPILPQAQGAELAFVHTMHLLSGFSLMGYALYSIWLFSSEQPRAALILWFIVLAIEIGFAFLFGWKGAFVPILLIPLIAYHYFRQRLRIRHVFFALIAGFLAMMFIVFPVIDTSRFFMTHVTGVPRSMEDIVSLSALVRDKLRGYSGADFLQAGWQRVVGRLIGFDHLYVIVRDVPEKVDLQKGRMFIHDFFLGWIPRFLWPEKPVIDAGRWFTEAFWDVSPDDPVTKSIMNIGEMYLNFHILGIIFGMLFLGVLYKIVYLYFITYGKTSVISVFIYIFIFLDFIRIDMDFATISLRILQNLVLLFLVSLFLVMKITGPRVRMNGQ